MSISPRIVVSVSFQQVNDAPDSETCAIGDDTVDGRPYAEAVEIARNYIQSVGGFEKFAEWGLV